MLRGDPEATRNVAETLVEIAEKAGLADYLAGGKRLRGWARAMGGDREVGLAELCDGIRALGEQGNRTYFPLFRAELAELVAEDEISDTPMALIEEGLGVAQRTGEHWTDGLLHRIRGDILLKADPTNSAPAEAAFLAAIAVAQQQKARSFELHAALSLAKLYQSAGRPIDAHDVLGPALAGFSPTPEFPQIAEAKALFEALAQNEAVKAALASHRQRVDLQVSYGQALLQGRELVAPETKAAFERARELSSGPADASVPEISLGLWAAAEVRGDYEVMLAFADELQRAVAGAPESGLAGIVHRVRGVTKHFTGDFVGARACLEQAVAMLDPARDGELALRFKEDPGVYAMGYLASVLWPLGEIDRARLLSEELTLRIAHLSNVASISDGNTHRVVLEMIRRDFGRAEPHVQAVLAIARDGKVDKWPGSIVFFEGWREWQTGLASTQASAHGYGYHGGNRDPAVAAGRRAGSRRDRGYVPLGGQLGE